MLKAKVHQFLNVNIYFQKFIYLLIILNVLSIILASFKELYLPNEMLFESFEYFSVFIFSIEYILRLWTADLDSKNGSSISKRLKFSFSTYGLVDLFAILPFYLPFIFPFDLRFIRILRLFRLFRIFKLARLSKSLRTITAVLKASKNELAITFFLSLIHI